MLAEIKFGSTVHVKNTVVAADQLFLSLILQMIIQQLNLHAVQFNQTAFATASRCQKPGVESKRISIGSLK
jgi:hypothetical protein